MITFRDDLYDQSDVLLSADVFENFWDVCIKYDPEQLDPACYYTAPVIAWDAAVKKTKAQLELLTDSEMLLMIKKDIRGNISLISNKYGKSK